MIQSRTTNPRRCLLNEAIADGFKTKAFHQRTLQRLQNTWESLSTEQTTWLQSCIARVNSEETATAKTRLARKLTKATEQSVRTTAQGASRFANAERVRNLTSQSLPQPLLDLLSKGPKFALTQSPSHQTNRLVEIGVERAIQALRWRDHFHRHPQTASAAPAVRLPASFNNTAANQAPVSDRPTEAAYKETKKRIQAAFKHRRPPGASNANKEQLEALKSLRKDESIIVKPSDKGKGLVLLNKDDYVTKAQTVTSTYQKLKGDPTRKTEAETKRIIKTRLQDKVESRTIMALLPQSSRAAELYGLPKDHKPDIPLRPIVSACGDPLDKITWFLERIATQLLHHVPAHLKNTDEYLNRLKQQYPDNKLPEKSIIFSVDVVNLYGNIPPDEATEALLELLADHHSEINTFNLETDDLRALLTHCLSNNNLRFGSHYYRQVTGIAMGSRIAPPLAIIFMGALERKFLEATTHKPDIYMRYIDDVLGVWTHGEDKLLEFVSELNSIHPSIKFTMESSTKTGSIAFLDTTISVKPDGSYTTELYIKPTSAGVIMNYDSAQPATTKRAVLKSQIQRAIRLSSDEEAQHRSINLISELFANNGYPKRAIKSAVWRALHPTRPEQQKKKDSTTRIILPYIDDDVARTVNGIIKNSGLDLRPAWTNNNTIRQRLVRSALEPPPCPGGGRACNTCAAGLAGRCHTSNVVYKITCCLCNITYVGETGRMIRYRFNEHLADARNRRCDSPFGDHFRDSHPNHPVKPADLAITILQKTNNIKDRKIAESIHIREELPKLNTQATSWLLL